MEERKDFLSLGAGKHFEVPFDVLLIFSTNIDPLELADEAFLRRMGYKIRFDYVDPAEYVEIWRQVCREKDMPFDPEVLRYVLEELHVKRKVPLLPCHPRDLLGLAEDHCRYQGKPNTPTIELMDWAWDNYFIEWGG